MEPIAIVSAVCFGLIFTGSVVWFACKCRKPHMKESRSDGDLVNMIEQGESA